VLKTLTVAHVVLPLAVVVLPIDGHTLPRKGEPVVQDPCSHPISRQAWAIMTPSQRTFQQLADSFTTKYIHLVFGEGPYPPCLYQSVRDYFYAPAGAGTEELQRANERRQYVRSVMVLLAGRGPQ